MRRIVVLLLAGALLILAIVGSPIAAHAAPTYEAKVTSWTWQNLGGGDIFITSISGTVNCPFGNFSGKVVARVPGKTIFAEHVFGHCTGAPFVWDIGLTKAYSKVTCFTALTFDGVITLDSDHAPINVTPRYSHGNSCPSRS